MDTSSDITEMTMSVDPSQHSNAGQNADNGAFEETALGTEDAEAAQAEIAADLHAQTVAEIWQSIDNNSPVHTFVFAPTRSGMSEEDQQQ